MGAYNTLGDMNFKGKRVLLRVDINCPMDKKTLKIINDVRIRAVIPTIRELLGKKAKLVILAHQSRKGKWDFTDLSQHAQLLSKNLNTDETVSSAAVSARTCFFTHSGRTGRGSR